MASEEATASFGSAASSHGFPETLPHPKENLGDGEIKTSLVMWISPTCESDGEGKKRPPHFLLLLVLLLDEEIGHDENDDEVVVRMLGSPASMDSSSFHSSAAPLLPFLPPPWQKEGSPCWQRWC